MNQSSGEVPVLKKTIGLCIAHLLIARLSYDE
jgi:hypothetical protein